LIEKPLIIILFVYAVSFGVLGAQFLADAFNVTIYNLEGDEIRSPVEDMVNIDAINQRTLEITQTNQTELVSDPAGTAASIAWTMFLLLTGMYVFNILILFGVPLIFVVPFAALFLIMLGRSLIALIRGI